MLKLIDEWTNKNNRLKNTNRDMEEETNGPKRNRSKEEWTNKNSRLKKDKQRNGKRKERPKTKQINRGMDK